MQIDDAVTKLSGLAGALVSLKFLSGSWPQRVSTVLGGAVVSWFATPYVVQKMSLPEGFAAFMLGLFGMSILSRLWEWVQTVSVSGFIASFFKVPKVPPEDKDST